MTSSITGNTATSGAKQSNTWIKFSLLEHNTNTTPNATAPTIAQDIKNNKQDREERELFRNLSSVSGDYARYKDINPERVPGTCEWFLGDDRFCEWRDSQNGALLWASAGPGCGKSVLSRCLIDEGHLTPNSTSTIEPLVIKTSPESVAVCYFFFKEGGEGRMDGAHALCAILHQLFQHPLTSNLISHALPSHKIHAKSLTQKMELLWQILIDCAESSSADIICVLDALDECREDSARQLLGMIKKSYSQHDQLPRLSKLKFLITSRPYDGLKGVFDTLQSVATYMHFDGDENGKSRQIGEEINLVIDARVRNIAETFSDEARNRISKRLKRMENRTYLWLHLTFNIIEKKRSAYGRSVDIEQLLNELPSQVSDAYEEILSKSQDERKVEALLQIVLAATRPLTLDEANNALVLALEEGEFLACATLQESLWPQDTFERIVQNLCGLFIRIHDSKLSFIHQTARAFLVSRGRTGTWKGRLDLSKSHGILSRACLNYLQIFNCDCGNSGKEYHFFDYAARNWFLHFRLQDAASTNILRKPAREFCHISSARARYWLNYCAGYLRLQDLADLHLAAQLGLAAVVHDLIVHEHADVNKRIDVDVDGRRWRSGSFFGSNATPLHLALKEGHLEVVEVLLDPTHGVKVNENDISIAVSHDSKAEAMVTLLLDKHGRNIKITESTLGGIIRNRRCGVAILTLLLMRCGHEIKITESLVIMAAGQGQTETMSLLLDERGNDFKITEDVVKTAVRYNEREMLALLLKRRRHEVNITEAVLIAAMESKHPEVLDLLLDHHSNEIKITEKMVRTAAGNSYGPQMLQLLLERHGHDIFATEGIFEAAAGNSHGPGAMSLLLNRYNLRITGNIFKAAIARRHYSMPNTVSLLLDKRGHEFVITEDIVKVAVANELYAKRLMLLLLDKRGHEFVITEDIVKVAVANERYAKALMLLLLDKRGHEFTITKSIVHAAVANKGRDDVLGMVTLLLDRCELKHLITEDIFTRAVYNTVNGVGIVALLLDRCGHEIEITEDTVKEARKFGSMEMSSLLQRRRDRRLNLDLIKQLMADKRMYRDQPS